MLEPEPYRMTDPPRGNFLRLDQVSKERSKLPFNTLERDHTERIKKELLSSSVSLGEPFDIEQFTKDPFHTSPDKMSWLSPRGFSQSQFKKCEVARKELGGGAWERGGTLDNDKAWIDGHKPLGKMQTGRSRRIHKELGHSFEPTSCLKVNMIDKALIGPSSIRQSDSLAF